MGQADEEAGLFVSNPLRLEGDVITKKFVFRGNMFLIHYGWRGTRLERVQRLDHAVFLIHYGWRGT